MGLFRRDKNKNAAPLAENAVHPLVSRVIFCTICRGERPFSKCWKRSGMVTTCTACNQPLGDPRTLYHHQQQPKCPHCEEYLEQPDFEYGICDGCGAKYEIMQGTKPGLLPNKQQRDSMDRHGRSRDV